MIYKVKGGPWRKAKAYAIRQAQPFHNTWALLSPSVTETFAPFYFDG